MVRRLALMEVTVQVPASTTNLGPGFDCLGVALQIWNRTRVCRVNGSSTSASPRPKMVDEAAQAFFSNSRISPFEFNWSLEGDVPPARGLGSSVTLRLGVLLGLNQLSDNVYSTSEIKQLCDQLEGHPDNTAAALNGGFTIVNARRNVVQRFEVSSDLHFVLFIPDFEVTTSEARKVLPATYPRADIVENLANVALIAAAFASHDYGSLRDAFNDHLHEPYREPLVPMLRDLVHAGQKAGALGGFLSGSGSTIACLTTQNPQPVADAMRAAAENAKGTINIVQADNSGARIL
jgi:homoserine kinase